jgi:hypothetical protein
MVETIRDAPRAVYTRRALMRGAGNVEVNIANRAALGYELVR